MRIFTKPERKMCSSVREGCGLCCVAVLAVHVKATLRHALAAADRFMCARSQRCMRCMPDCFHTSAVQNDTTFAIDRSAWVITAFDSAPIADALPDMPLVPTETHPHDTMVGDVTSRRLHHAMPSFLILP